MMNPVYIYYVGAVCLIALLVATIVRVVRKQERFAVFVQKEYQGLMGPGIFLKLNAKSRWILIKINDRVKIAASDHVRISDVDVPMETLNPELVGKLGRVVNFAVDKLVVVVDEV